MAMVRIKRPATVAADAAEARESQQPASFVTLAERSRERRIEGDVEHLGISLANLRAGFDQTGGKRRRVGSPPQDTLGLHRPIHNRG